MSVLLISLPAAYISSYLKCKGMHKAARELSSLQVLLMCCWMFTRSPGPWTMAARTSQPSPVPDTSGHTWALWSLITLIYGCCQDQWVFLGTAQNLSLASGKSPGVTEEVGPGDCSCWCGGMCGSCGWLSRKEVKS